MKYEDLTEEQRWNVIMMEWGFQIHHEHDDIPYSALWAIRQENLDG